ncbi:uncharacterized protein [Euwallacea fornicatus]|uniref:uncharacterized protein n=1 Tax=Euwallacea fornicatus TaxID=995702 RepID=UPI00338FDBCD
MINNKLILASALLACFVYTVYADAPDAAAQLINRHSKELIEECEKEIGTTVQEVQNASDNDEKKMCFHKCLITKDGFISTDGAINIEHIKEYFSSNAKKPKNVDAVISCLEAIGRINSCQEMSKMKTCFKQ